MKLGRYVKLRKEKFGKFVFDTLNEKVYVANSAGKDVLDLLADGGNLAEIAGHLVNRYDAPASKIRDDVLSFVNFLRTAGLLAIETEVSK
jgi:hypothetical protein